MNSNRSSKRELITIDDDDSSSEQPAVKNMKSGDTPIPSPEVIELQREMAVLKLAMSKLEKNFQSPEVIELERKVAELQETNGKLENKFQGACRIAGEAQARVQFLEQLIDSKKAVDGAKNNTEREDELEKKVHDLTNRLEEQLKKYKKKKEKRNVLKKRVINVTNQLENERLRHRATIQREDELEEKLDERTDQLGKFEKWADKVQFVPGFSGPPKPSFPFQKSDVYFFIPPKIHDTAHPTNILQLCRSDAPETLSVDNALKNLEAIMHEHGRERVVKYLRGRLTAENVTHFECSVCQKTIPSHNVLEHFLSTKHTNKMHSFGGAISFTALVHWFKPLQSTKAELAADGESEESTGDMGTGREPIEVITLD